MTQTFDAIIVGAGQAGPPLAGRLTAAGRQVALVERHLFGGTCVNTGCTPTKTLVASAHAAHLARRAAEFGVTLGGPVGIDFAAVMRRKDAVVGASRHGVETWLRGMPGCTVFEGHARFAAPDRILVGDAELSAPLVFLNVGGRAIVPDMPGLDRVPVLTNTSILSLTTLPGHLLIVGGSYIALEFAQMFRRFGSAVTVIERGPRLVAREDPEVSDAVRSILEAEGVAVRLGAANPSFAPHQDGVAVTIGGDSVTGSHLLVAVGRRPNTDDLGLDRAGIHTDGHGAIVVDDRLETSVPGIFALGDCNGRGAFTHTAYNDFEIVADNLLDKADRRVTDRIPAYALYIDPPLGRVSQTETEARKAGRPVLVGRRPMTRVSRAVEKGETQGLIKVVVDAETRAILGAAILGVGGDEAVHGLIDAMAAGAGADGLRRTMHIHPTVSELVPTVLGELERTA